MHGRANVNYGYAPSPYSSSPQPTYPQPAYPQPAYPQPAYPAAAHSQHPAYPSPYAPPGPQPPSYHPQQPSYAPQAPSYAPHPASGTYPPAVGGSGIVPIAPRRSDDSWGRITLPPALHAPPRGMPSAMAFLLGLVGVGVALACDLVFLRVNVPFAGAYAWYLTTALSFFCAGWAAGKWTRAGRGLAIFVAVFSGIVYGCGDIALGVLVESLSRAGAIHLAAQGLAIAVATGLAGALRGVRAR